jgi:2-phosphosulfolactate phosphatase
MPKIEVCLSPELLPLFKLEDKIVVVIDVLRASSCMVTGLAHGITEILPVASLEESATYGLMGYITAAERNGMKMDGFDLDNSPFSYMDPVLAGKKICMTTTNGTQAILQSAHAKKVIIGTFLNLKTVSDYLYIRGLDVVLLCAGWKGQVNAEDSLFAGAVMDVLKGSFTVGNDSALLARDLYHLHKDDLEKFLLESSHYQRLKRLGIQKDISFCLRHSIYECLPRLEHNSIIAQSSFSQ